MLSSINRPTIIEKTSTSPAEPAAKHLTFGAGVLALAAVYFASAKLGLALAFQAEQVTAVWPPTGIALAAVLLFGYRVWPGIALGALLANLAAPNETVPTACGIAVGNTLEALFGAWLLHRVIGFRSSLDRLRDVLGLVILAGAGSTMLSATIGVTSLCLGGVQPWATYDSLWALWWLGDSAGAVLVAPLLLTWATRQERPSLLRRRTEAAALLGAVLLVSLVVFAGGVSPAFSRHPLEYTIFPFVVWAALRFGQPGSTAVTFVTSCIAIWGTVHGYGPFATGTIHQNLILLQVFMAIVAVTALLLSAAISERMRTEQALQEADRRKNEFLATLAHELRNPLAPISNALHLLNLAGDQPDIQARARDIIDRQLGQMVRLVDDLLDVSRITQGKLQVRKQPMDLALAIQSALETTRPLMEEFAHELTVLLPPEPVPVDADPVRLAQVFTNLLNNAAKFTPKGGHIWLTAECQDSEVQVSVRDTGIGLAAEHLADLFAMFSQVAPALERSQGGLGIGLSLVRGLVELHGGRVEARSAGAGQGSEFLVRLPLAAGKMQGAQPEDAKGQPVSGPSSRILVVDDNHDSAASLAMMLQAWGHDIRTAHDGLEAVEAAEAFRPQVVLLDIGLPKMNGYEVARHLRQQPWGRDLLLVAVTGWGQEEDKRRAAEAGFNHHLTKPVAAATLEKLLAKSR